MTPRQNRREIFNQALELKDPKKQAAFLDEACAGDEKLRAEVDALLKWDSEAGSFMDFPDSDPNVTLEAAPALDATGTVIGRYKLLEKIGEGGMATVYMADQKHPIRRRVALKIIKLGMDTKQVIARFEAERQALAMMDHPNIARVFDAGSTDSGRPYFVMELVKGLPITEFCDTNHQTTQERLDLFISVCQAVHHAHQRGIIHRDIKPTNIMVTLHDGKPLVKVIDFGIAKAVNQQLTEKTVFTRYSQMIGTPEYMSPEQAEMSGLDIDTRTDVFSLGVLLYELLTGVTPFDSEYLLSKGYGELQRIIREEEPVKPSTKISTLGDSLVEIAKHRRTSPELLSKLIRSDLDWIVMKTLEKDRGRRYESVSELASDVQRHLDNEPVLAGRPSAVYWMQKFVKRNKVLVTAVTSIVAVVVFAAIISSISAVKATKAQRVAEKAEKEAIKQQLKAEEEKESAEQARVDALRAEEKATKAQDEAETLAEQRRRELYFYNIKLANEELEANRPAYALDYLNDCNEDLRNWEWHYLRQKVYSKETSPLVFDANVLSFDYSPDGSRLAVFCDDGQLFIHDRRTGSQSRPYPIRQDLELLQRYRDSGGSFQLMDFCPDGIHVAVLGDNNDVNLISIETGETVQSFPHTGYVLRIDCSPKDNLLVTFSWDDKGKVQLWDRESGDLLCGCPPNIIGESTFSPDGKHLFVGTFREAVEVYKVGDLLDGGQDARPVARFESQSFSHLVAISADGRRIAMVQLDNSILIMDGEYNEIAYLRGHTEWIPGLAFNADGTRLASVSVDRTTRLWDPETGREILQLGKLEPCNRNIHFGRSDRELILGNKTNVLQVLNASPLAESRTDTTQIYQNDNDGDSIAIADLEYDESGGRLVSTDWASGVRLWNAEDGQLISPIGRLDNSCRATFSPDSQWIAATGVRDGNFVVEVWEADPPYNRRFGEKTEGETFALTFSADSRYLIVGARTWIVYDCNTWKRISELEMQGGLSLSTATSSDGKYFASSCNDGSVKIWDAQRLDEEQDGDVVCEGQGSTGYFVHLDFRPNSSYLVMGMYNGDIKILDVPSKQTVRMIRGAHVNEVSGVSFSPDGKYLASSGTDRVVRIWDVKTGDLIDMLIEHEEPVLSVAFSPDGKQVASGGYAGIIRIWTPKLD